VCHYDDPLPCSIAFAVKQHQPSRSSDEKIQVFKHPSVTGKNNVTRVFPANNLFMIMPNPRLDVDAHQFSLLLTIFLLPAKKYNQFAGQLLFHHYRPQ
jgi:hypothetical protein